MIQVAAIMLVLRKAPTALTSPVSGALTVCMQPGSHHGVRTVGFSSHHFGIAVIALAATWVERPFTLDRTWRGTYHGASLAPGGMRRLVRDVDTVARGVKPKEAELLPVDVEIRRKPEWESATSGRVA